MDGWVHGQLVDVALRLLGCSGLSAAEDDWLEDLQRAAQSKLARAYDAPSPAALLQLCEGMLAAAVRLSPPSDSGRQRADVHNGLPA